MKASSSNAARSKMIGHFVGMGFAEKLVLKAIYENGIDNRLFYKVTKVFEIIVTI